MQKSHPHPGNNHIRGFCMLPPTILGHHRLQSKFVLPLEEYQGLRFFDGADSSIKLLSQTQLDFRKCYKNQLMFNDLWFADRLDACIEHMSTLQH